MGIKRNIYILAIRRKNKSGVRVTLFQRLYYQGRQWQHALNISIPADYYNAEKEIVVKGDIKDYANRIITESKQTLQDIFLRYELVEHKTPDFDEIIENYCSTMSLKGLIDNKGHSQKIFFVDKIDEFIQEGRKFKSWTVSTEKKFIAMRTHWQDYEAYKKSKFVLNELKEKDILEYFDYLCDVRHNTNTTLQKKAGIIRWYLRWCYKKKYYSGDLYDTFRPKYKGGNFEQHKIIYLTEEELKALEEKTFTKRQGYLERVRDVFIFACYSGLRHSDVLSLTPENIIDDKIELVTRKTNDRISINLNKRTRAILDKYMAWADLTGKCLPVISNQKTNDYLSELCKLCNIDTPTTQITFIRDKRIEICCPKYELITFHAARRTFITHALRLGIPVPVIMKFSGHHSVNMLKPYMQIVDELKKKEMAKFDEM